ncbi:hypothetical protein [Streptococcus porci]|nr:hypothetical protein [Streptococcus porci]
MIIGVASAQIKLAKDFLASRNDNPDYLQGLEVMQELLIAQLAENMEDCL